MITQPYNLNLIPGGVPVRVPVSQYDAGSRDITFALYSGSMAFTVPSEAVVTCDGAKPDRKGFSYLCGHSGSTATVTVTEQMTAVPSETECQLTIRKDGAVLGSANFLLVVERAALPDGADISETEINAFTQIANAAAESAQAAREVMNTLDDAKEALDASTEAAETANTELTASTSAANTARTKLTTATNNANTARGSLETATSAANTAKDALQKPTTDAQEIKTALDTANQTAADNIEALTNADKLAQKITKVSPATAGNLPALTAAGELTDSGKKPDDFAPSGYGLGMTSGQTVSDCNTAVRVGFYALSGASTVNAPANSTLQYGTLLVERRGGAIIIQTAKYETMSAVRYSYDNGATWSEWEWVNPPMVVGTEYRTTERWNRKPVYTKLVDCGVSANGKNVNPGISSTAIIRAKCNIERVSVHQVWQNYTPNSSYDVAFFIFDAIILYCGSAMTNLQTYVQIWYVK